jgi:hypothetical protein
VVGLRDCDDIRFTASCSVISDHCRHDFVYSIVRLFDDFAMKESRIYLEDCIFVRLTMQNAELMNMVAFCLEISFEPHALDKMLSTVGGEAKFA